MTSDPLYPVVATARAAAPGRDMRIRVGGGRREAGWPVAEGRAGGFAGEPICGDGGADGGGGAAAAPPRPRRRPGLDADDEPVVDVPDAGRRPGGAFRLLAFGPGSDRAFQHDFA